MLLFGIVVIVIFALFVLYSNLVLSVNEESNVESSQAAITTLGTVAQAFGDLVKVALGAVIGTLSATLEFIIG